MRPALVLVPLMLLLPGCTDAPAGDGEWWGHGAHCATYFVSLQAPGLYHALPSEGGRGGFVFAQRDPKEGLPLHVTGLTEDWNGTMTLLGAEWKLRENVGGWNEGWRVHLRSDGTATIVGDFPEGTRDRQKLEQFHNLSSLVFPSGERVSGLAQAFLRERHETDDGHTNHFVDAEGPYRFKPLLESLVRQSPPRVEGGSGDGIFQRELSWQDWTFIVGVPVRKAEATHETGRLALLANAADGAEFRYGSGAPASHDDVYAKLNETLRALALDDMGIEPQGLVIMGAPGCGANVATPPPGEGAAQAEANHFG